MSTNTSGTSLPPEKPAKEDVEQQQDSFAKETGVQHQDNSDIIVDWDGPTDPLNPSNWSAGARWSQIIVVSLLGLVTCVLAHGHHVPLFPCVLMMLTIASRNMGPTICAPGISKVTQDLQIVSPTLSTLSITIYMLGMGIGPMLVSALGEIYGRLPVYHVSNVVFIAFLVGCALSKNVAQFMICRFFAGFAGGTPMALGGGTIADITTVDTRASAMALFGLGFLCGPVRDRLLPLLRLFFAVL